MSSSRLRGKSMMFYHGIILTILTTTINYLFNYPVLWSLYIIAGILFIHSSPSYKTFTNMIIVFTLSKTTIEYIHSSMNIPMQDVITTIVNTIILFLVSYLKINQTQKEKRMEYSLYIDPLTEAYNRRVLETIVSKLMTKTIESNKPLSCIVFDIDYFKKINDNYGHLFGDSVLKMISKIVRENIRSSDCLIRIGGEEFIIFLRDTSATAACDMAERIRYEIESYPFKYNEEIVPVTMSLGVAIYSPQETMEEFIDRADEALYKAKESGRNRTMIFDKNKFRCVRSNNVSVSNQ